LRSSDRGGQDAAGGAAASAGQNGGKTPVSKYKPDSNR